MLLRIATIGLAVTVLSLVACPGPAAGPGPTPTVPIPPEAQQPVQAAKADLARRTGVDQARIAVTEIEAVEWPSTALGCQQPGMMYAQVITPGYRVVLAAESQTYRYHTDKGSTVVLCEQ